MDENLTTPSAPKDKALANAPRTYRGQERRAQILEVAADLFLARGYADVSVDEIIKFVGGSKTNVYTSFGGKEGLFVEVVRNLCGTLLAEFKAIKGKSRDVRTSLRVLGIALLDVVLHPRVAALRRLVVAESNRFPEIGEIWMESGRQEIKIVVANVIERWQAAGALREGDSMTMATLLYDMFTSSLAYMMIFGQCPSKKMQSAHVDAVVETFLFGCGTKPAE